MANDIERKMKKIIVTITSSMLLIIFFSCNSPSHDLNDKDTDLVSDHDNIADADEISEIEADDSNESDADIDDSYNEFSGLSFKTRPHGITRWDEKFSYFIRCESGKKTETLISVTEDDTCKGTINSDTYVFTPINEKIPSGRCVIAVECSDGENRITQKTHIQIPNPFQFAESFDEPLIFNPIWSKDEYAVFFRDNELFSFNIESDKIELLGSFLGDFSGHFFPVDNFLYYLSQDGMIFKTDGTIQNTTKIEISNESEDNLNFKVIRHVFKNDNILLQTYDEQMQTGFIYYYDSVSKEIIPVELPESWWMGTTCSEKECVAYDFISEKMFGITIPALSASEICPDEIKNHDGTIVFADNKIFYKYEKTLNSIDIQTCEKTTWSDCENPENVSINRIPGEEVFYTVGNCETSTVLRIFFPDGTDKSTSLNTGVTDIHTNEGVVFFFKYYDENISKPQKCLRVLNTAEDSILIPDKICNPDEQIVFSGFFNDSAVFNLFGAELNVSTFLIKSNASIESVAPAFLIKNVQGYFKNAISLNGKDFFTVSTGRYWQMFETDGTKSGTKMRNMITNVWNLKLISASENEVIFDIADDKTHFINSFDITTGKKKTITSKENCKFGNFPFPGTYDYKLRFGNFAFFGVSDTCGVYSLWTTDGTSKGTIDHDIKITHYTQGIGYEIYDPELKAHSDSFGGHYLGKYYFNSLHEKAIDTGVSGYILGFIEDFLIVCSTKSEHVFEITALKKGKIVSSFVYESKGQVSDVSMSGSNIQLLETIGDNETSVANVLFFSDGDLSKKPLFAELFDSGYSSVKKIASNETFTIYSAKIKGASSVALKSVYLAKSGLIIVSEPLYYYNKDSEFNCFSIIGKDLICDYDGVLFSIPVDKKIFAGIRLLEKEGDLRYLGTSFSGEAVIKVSSDSSLVVTGGKKENTKITKIPPYSRISFWNDWILEYEKAFIVEDEKNLLNHVEIKNKELNNQVRYKSERAIYLFEDPGLYIYNLPKTELFF